MKNIYLDALRIEEANDLFTKCLISLEEDNLAQTIDYIETCYDLTDSIEQRLALLFLIEMTKKTLEDRKRILENVYSV